MFNKWLDIFVSEKGIDLEDGFEVEGATGPNHMQYVHVIDAMKSTTDAEQKKLKSMLVTIDVHNGDIRDYLRHLAQAIAL